MHGAHGKPLQIAGKTEHLDIQWGEARGRASFIVIVGLESPPCLIGMDIMRPLRVHIDVTNGTTTPAQLDPQTVHLNAAQSQQQQKELPSHDTDPPLVSQPLGETPSPRASLSPGGTADPSSTRPQRQEIPLSGARSSPLPSPEIPPPAAAGTSRTLPSAPLSPAPPCIANPHTASCARLLQTADIPPQDSTPCPLPQSMAHRGRPILPERCSPSLCDRHSSALQWSGALDCRAQSPARASPASLRAKHRRPRSGRSRGDPSLRLNHLLTSSKTVPTTTPRAPLTAPAATAKQAIP